MNRYHVTLLLLVLLVLTGGEANENVGNNTNIELREVINMRRVRYHKTLNTLWTLQSSWGLLGTILNGLIVYALYTKRQAMATSVNMIIMSVMHFEFGVRPIIFFCLRIDQMYRVFYCAVLVPWRSYLMYFRTPLLFHSEEHFNLVR